jgi:hypothetical protein
MKTCTNHNFIVVHQEDSCPVCRMERQLREARREADRLGRDNDRLCDKVFELQQEARSLPTGIQEALNMGNGTYRP